MAKKTIYIKKPRLLKEELLRSEFTTGVELEAIFSPLRHIILTSTNANSALNRMRVLGYQNFNASTLRHMVLQNAATEWNITGANSIYRLIQDQNLPKDDQKLLYGLVENLYSNYQSSLRYIQDRFSLLKEELAKYGFKDITYNEVLELSNVYSSEQSQFGTKIRNIEDLDGLVSIASQIRREHEILDSTVFNEIRGNKEVIENYINNMLDKKPRTGGSEFAQTKINKRKEKLINFFEKVVKPRLGEIKSDGSLKVSDNMWSYPAQYQVDVTFELASPALSFSPQALSKTTKIIKNLLLSGCYTNHTCSLHTHVSWNRLKEEDRIWCFTVLLNNKELYKQFKSMQMKDKEINFVTNWSSERPYPRIAGAQDIRATFKNIDDSMLPMFHKYSLINYHKIGTLEWRGPRGFLDSPENTEFDLENFANLTHDVLSGKIHRSEFTKSFHKIKKQIEKDVNTAMRGFSSYVQKTHSIMNVLDTALALEKVEIDGTIITRQEFFSSTQRKDDKHAMEIEKILKYLKQKSQHGTIQLSNFDIIYLGYFLSRDEIHTLNSSLDHIFEIYTHIRSITQNLLKKYRLHHALENKEIYPDSLKNTLKAHIKTLHTTFKIFLEFLIKHEPVYSLFVSNNQCALHRTRVRILESIKNLFGSEYETNDSTSILGIIKPKEPGGSLSPGIKKDVSFVLKEEIDKIDLLIREISISYRIHQDAVNNLGLTSGNNIFEAADLLIKILTQTVGIYEDIQEYIEEYLDAEQTALVKQRRLNSPIPVSPPRT